MHSKVLIGNGTQKQHRRENQTRQSQPNKQVQQRKAHSKSKKQVANPRCFPVPTSPFHARRIDKNRTAENERRSKLENQNLQTTKKQENKTHKQTNKQTN